MEQPGIHDEEAPDWPPRDPATATPEPRAADDTADEDVDEPTVPLPGLDEPTLELPILELPILELPGLEPARSGPRRLAVAAVLVALLLVGFLIVRSGDSPSFPSNATAAPTGTPAPSATADGRTEAAFDLVDGVAAVRLRTADLGTALYRVTTPPGTGVRPRVVEQDGRVQLFLDNAGDAPGAVDIVLAQRVRWALRVGGGVDLSTIDLSGARLAAVDLAGNATRIDLTLPRPDGTLTVRMNGGVSAFTVRSAQQVPVRVRVGSGAGEVVLDGQTHSGVAAGALFTPGRWADAVDRIDLDATAGMSALTVAAY